MFLGAAVLQTPRRAHGRNRGLRIKRPAANTSFRAEGRCLRRRPLQDRSRKPSVRRRASTPEERSRPGNVRIGPRPAHSPSSMNHRAFWEIRDAQSQRGPSPAASTWRDLAVSSSVAFALRMRHGEMAESYAKPTFRVIAFEMRLMRFMVPVPRSPC